MNGKQVSLRSVHEHKGGVVDGRGLLGRVLCPLSSTDIGPRRSQALKGDRRGREEGDDADLDIELRGFVCY